MTGNDDGQLELPIFDGEPDEPGIKHADGVQDDLDDDGGDQ